MIKVPVQEVQLRSNDLIDIIRAKYPDLPEDIDAIQICFPHDNNWINVLYHDHMRIHIRFSNPADVKAAEALERMELNLPSEPAEVKG